MSRIREDTRSWLQGAFGATHISDRVIEFHEAFMPVYEGCYRNLVEEIHVALEEIPVHNPYFNDHGPRHTERILENITLLERAYNLELNQSERFLLAASAWLHDIGMSINQKVYVEEVSITDDTDTAWFREIGSTGGDGETVDDSELIRKWHHILSWDFVRNHHDRLGFPNFRIANYVAEVSRVHRRREDTNTVSERETIDALSVRDEVALRDLAALFQFADALDIGKRRAPEISSYVQNLPEESQMHWDVCQLISSLDVDTSSNKLLINASHSTEEERELLEEKAEHVYDEYEDVRDILGAEPFELFINDVIVRSESRKPRDVETEISGHQQYYEKRNQETERIREDQMAKFRDINNRWNIRIHNEQGDATVARECTMELLEDTYRRTHFVRSFDNPMEWDWSEDVEVYDTDGEPLRFEKKMDRPNDKRFQVRLPEHLGAHDVYTYTYEYNWGQLFPQEEEVYIVTGNARKVEFDLHYPDNMELTNVHCKETDQQSGEIVKKVDQKFIAQGDCIEGVMDKESTKNQVEICWEVV